MRKIIKLCYFIALLVLVLIISPLLIASDILAYNSIGKYIDNNKLNVNVVGFDNNSPGDCIIINYKDVQILIDSAQNKDNFDNVIKPKMQSLLSEEDKVWDYILFTHGDKDHIGNANSVFDFFYGSDGYSIANIIDYDFDYEKYDNNDRFIKSLYSKTGLDYRNKRNQLIKGKSINYFTASSLSEKDKIKTFNLGNGLYLDILYNYYDNYDVLSKLCSNIIKPNDSLFEEPEDEFEDEDLTLGGVYKNLLSLCVLLRFGNNSEQKLLFTGDLPELDSANNYYKADGKYGGETRLLEYHKNLLDGVTFFKAGHHGSLTSNCNEFINVIRPKYVAITKGPSFDSDIYAKYPYNEVLNRLLKYTENICITKTCYGSENDSLGYVKPLYGDLLYRFDTKNVDVFSELNSDSHEKAVKIKNAHFYKLNENTNTWEIDNDLNFLEEARYHNDISLSEKENFYDAMQVYTISSEYETYENCTLVKYGDIDIVIDCGAHKAEKNNDLYGLVARLKKYILDDKIEYLIISCYKASFMNELFDESGLFSNFNVENVICSYYTNAGSMKGSYYNHLIKYTNENKINRIDLTDKITISIDTIANKLSTLEVYTSGITNSEYEDDYSLVTKVTFNETCKIVFLGNLLIYNEKFLNDKTFKNIAYLKLPSSFDNIELLSATEYDNLKKFYNLLNPVYKVVGCEPGVKVSGISYLSEEKLAAYKGLFSKNIIYSSWDESSVQGLVFDFKFEYGYDYITDISKYSGLQLDEKQMH